MSEHRIQPTNITKPMQLLAAWLVGLLAIDSCFLLAGAKMPDGSIQQSALILAAILNVPIFLVALFLLQTKFRPELQEDLYYSTYINQKTNEKVSVTRDDQRLAAVLACIDRMEMALATRVTSPQLSQTQSLLSGVLFGINRHLEDRVELARLLGTHGVHRHTWFGGENPPDRRVVSISRHLPRETQMAVLDITARLGFLHYNRLEEVEGIDEDVLIGSYGIGNLNIPQPVAN